MGDIRLKAMKQFATSVDGDTFEFKFESGQTAKGLHARRCGNPDCGASFCLGPAPEERAASSRHASRQPGENGTTCPYCCHEGPDNEFLPQEDKDHALQHVAELVKHDVREMISDVFRKSTRRSKRSLISIEFKAPPRRPVPRYVPRQEPEKLRALRCSGCERQYGTHGPALFCPDCGAGTIRDHLTRERELFDEELHAANEGKERTFRRLANLNVAVVSVFEVYMKMLHRHIVVTRLAPELHEKALKVRNDFQRVDGTRGRFSSFAFDPFATLSPPELARFNRLINARHVAGHNLGITDKPFVDRTGHGKVGEPLKLSSDELEWFMDTATNVLATSAANFRELRTS